jgi:hypothetical protein
MRYCPCCVSSALSSVPPEHGIGKDEPNTNHSFRLQKHNPLGSRIRSLLRLIPSVQSVPPTLVSSHPPPPACDTQVYIVSR